VEIYFFKSNVQFVINALNKSKGCGFWFSDGLISYKGIDSVINFEKIWIEETIFKPFHILYPELTQKYCVEIFESNPTRTKGGEKLLFFASNDSHVFIYRDVLSKTSLKYSVYTRAKNSINAGAILKHDKVNHFSDLTYGKIKNFNTLILCNDWGPLEQQLNMSFLLKSKNTICIQESVIDFNKKIKRMLHCSFPIFQGIVTLKGINIEGRIMAVIGNPRYENLRLQEVEKIENVLINVNFTYGIHENERDEWIKDVLNSCAKLHLNYSIVQHPQDRSDLSDYNVKRTNASNIHFELENTGVLITRFSSLIHEALCLGRYVIYFNPHNEKLIYDFEADNICLFYAENVNQLISALKQISQNHNTIRVQDKIKTYLTRHIGTTSNGNASSFVAEFIKDVINYPIVRRVRFFDVFKVKLKKIKRKVFKQEF
jgi:hypothetical protein